MQATVASLLELELNDVPNFKEMPEDKWGGEFINFFDKHGYEYHGEVSYEANNNDHLIEENSIHGFFYTKVPSKTFHDVSHAVIINVKGLVVHDPNPNKRYQWENVLNTGNVIQWSLFVKKDNKEK